MSSSWWYHHLKKSLLRVLLGSAGLLYITQRDIPWNRDQNGLPTSMLKLHPVIWICGICHLSFNASNLHRCIALPLQRCLQRWGWKLLPCSSAPVTFRGRFDGTSNQVLAWILKRPKRCKISCLVSLHFYASSQRPQRRKRSASHQHSKHQKALRQCIHIHSIQFSYHAWGHSATIVEFQLKGLLSGKHYWRVDKFAGNEAEEGRATTNYQAPFT